EVQTGLGRTGRWFGFQHDGVRPDVVTMAKALGNGVPVGACWARAEVAGVFRPGDHATTFGGQPLAMAAARAVLATLEAADVPGPGPGGRALPGPRPPRGPARAAGGPWGGPGRWGGRGGRGPAGGGPRRRGPAGPTGWPGGRGSPRCGAAGCCWRPSWRGSTP